jgi:hypothetical protein
MKRLFLILLAIVLAVAELLIATVGGGRAVEG